MALLLFLARSDSSKTSPKPSGRERPLTRTGDATEPAWKARRLPLVVKALSALGVAADDAVALAQRVALSILAQWAHETGRGTHEYNFNLGGWHARTNDDFFTAKGAGEGVVHWTAYPDLETAIADQVKRLKVGYPSAWALLLGAPEKSAWVERLGKLGYYGASPAAYAAAWLMHRAELGGAPSSFQTPPVPAGAHVVTAFVDGRAYSVAQLGGGEYLVISKAGDAYDWFGQNGDIESAGRTPAALATLQSDMLRFDPNLFRPSRGQSGP